MKAAVAGAKEATAGEEGEERASEPASRAATWGGERRDPIGWEEQKGPFLLLGAAPSSVVVPLMSFASFVELATDAIGECPAKRKASTTTAYCRKRGFSASPCNDSGGSAHPHPGGGGGDAAAVDEVLVRRLLQCVPSILDVHYAAFDVPARGGVRVSARSGAVRRGAVRKRS